MSYNLKLKFENFLKSSMRYILSEVESISESKENGTDGD